MKILLPSLLLSPLLFAEAGSVEPRSRPVSKGPGLFTEWRSASPDHPFGDLEALIRYIEDLYRSESSTSTVELTVTRPRRVRRLTIDIWTRGTDKALIVIRSPAREKGYATLKVSNNLWNYLPRSSRTIRIPPSMMLGSWMGTDFTNDDLVQESSLHEDYDYRVVGAAECEDCWLIRLTAKPGIVGLWERIELVVAMDPILPVSASYYDRKGRLARTLTWDEVREFDGKIVPSRLTLLPTDERKAGHITQLRYLDIRFNANVPESTFSLSRLEQKK